MVMRPTFSTALASCVCKAPEYRIQRAGCAATAIACYRCNALAMQLALKCPPSTKPTLQAQKVQWVNIL